MQLPLVTVIIPTFNRRQWISICLDSIKAQTYPHIETLVIDDGSSDGTVEWLKSQPEYSFAHVHEQPKNGGASIARNDGIRLARGELIAFIDSDDALLPNHVDTAVKAFEEHPNIGLFCCDSTLIDSEGEVLFGGRTWHQIQSESRKMPVQTAHAPSFKAWRFSSENSNARMAPRAPEDDDKTRKRQAAREAAFSFCAQAFSHFSTLQRNFRANSSITNTEAVIVIVRNLRFIQPKFEGRNDNVPTSKRRTNSV